MPKATGSVINYLENNPEFLESYGRKLHELAFHGEQLLTFSRLLAIEGLGTPNDVCNAASAVAIRAIDTSLDILPEGSSARTQIRQALASAIDAEFAQVFEGSKFPGIVQRILGTEPTTYTQKDIQLLRASVEAAEVLSDCLFAYAENNPAFLEAHKDMLRGLDEIEIKLYALQQECSDDATASDGAYEEISDLVSQLVNGVLEILPDDPSVHAQIESVFARIEESFATSEALPERDQVSVGNNQIAAKIAHNNG